jgi:hypothetical protein
MSPLTAAMSWRWQTFWSAAFDRPIDEGSSDEFATIGGADEQRVEPALYFNKVPRRHAQRTVSTST